MGLPDYSVFWVIVFVLLLVFLLNQLLFKPVLAVMNARQAAVKHARDLAEKAAADAARAEAEFDAKTRDARKELAGHMEEARQTAEAARAALLDAARKQAADKTATAVAQLTDETAAARDRLQRESTDLAHLVAERVLGRPTA